MAEPAWLGSNKKMNSNEEAAMNDYVEELMEQRAQEWDQEVEDAEEM